MIYGLFVITLLVALLVFLLLNSKLIIESSSFKIPTPPPISKKKTYICKKIKSNEISTTQHPSRIN
jgi:hypothetical protein